VHFFLITLSQYVGSSICWFTDRHTKMFFSKRFLKHAFTRKMCLFFCKVKIKCLPTHFSYLWVVKQQTFFVSVAWLDCTLIMPIGIHGGSPSINRRKDSICSKYSLQPPDLDYSFPFEVYNFNMIMKNANKPSRPKYIVGTHHL
jgi:hypothetical protein